MEEHLVDAKLRVREDEVMQVAAMRPLERLGRGAQSGGRHGRLGARLGQGQA